MQLSLKLYREPQAQMQAREYYQWNIFGDPATRKAPADIHSPLEITQPMRPQIQTERGHYRSMGSHPDLYDRCRLQSQAMSGAAVDAVAGFAAPDAAILLHIQRLRNFFRQRSSKMVNVRSPLPKSALCCSISDHRWSCQMQGDLDRAAVLSNALRFCVSFTVVVLMREGAIRWMRAVHLLAQLCSDSSTWILMYLCNGRKAPTRGTTADDSAGNLRTLHGMIFGVPGIRESINLLESVFRNEDLKARLSC